jgi:SAM-dependent methyltransferase
MKDYQKIEQRKRDRSAEDYEAWLCSNKGTLFDFYERDLFCDFVRATVPNGPRSIVDLGSGTGRITEALAAQAMQIVGVDLSPRSVRVLLRKAVQNCSALCADLSSLPVKDQSFDVAVSCQVLPLMKHDELAMSLREIHRILRSGGIFIFSAYNYNYWRYRQNGNSTADADPIYKRFSRQSVYELAGEFHFAVKRIAYYKALPLRIFARTGWIAADRLVCSTPYLGTIAGAYLAAVLQKQD